MTVPAVEATPRNLHYGEFYGLTDPVPTADPDGRPVLAVHGNCQAESLRVLLDGRYGDRIRTIRLVPAHELVADDVPHLHRTLAQAQYLVTQPVAPGYRGLPVGTEELLTAAPHVRSTIVPVMRWAGLHPAQVIVRTPAGEPPIVPYHDLRVIAACRRAGDHAARVTSADLPQLDERAVAALRDASLAELTRRIEAHGAVDIRDALTRPGRRSVHVINHPTNDVLVEVADRIAAALDLGAPREYDPGRSLLGALVAPMDERAAAFAQVPMSDDDVARVWQVRGQAVGEDELVAAHAAWYAEHPQALADAVRRHATLLEIVDGDV